jgi:hypothetical protein
MPLNYYPTDFGAPIPPDIPYAPAASIGPSAAHPGEVGRARIPTVAWTIQLMV